MHTEVETLNSYSKKLKVDIAPEELNPIEKKVLKQYQKKADIPGFRRGHAPLGMVKKRFNDIIQQDIIEETLKKYYGKALEEAQIEPVAQGKITDFNYEDIKSGMQFEIEVEVQPEIELKKYKGLKVEKDIVEVTDEMVENALQHIREQYATVKEVEEAKEGDFLYFDVQELDKGQVPIIGHKYNDLQVELGLGKFDPQVESQLIGITQDEKRIVEQEQPPSPESKEQQPMKTIYEAHAKKIEEKEFPELNDEFVKNLDDENLETMDQLRDQVRKNIEIDIKNRSEQAFNNRIIDELLKENPFEVPPSLIDNYLNEMVADINRQAQEQEIDEDQIRKEYRAAAIHNIRWFYLKKKLEEAENISISDEEAINFIEESNLDEENKKVAKSNPQYLQRLKDDLLEKKVLDMLKEHAEIVEVYPTQQ